MVQKKKTYIQSHHKMLHFQYATQTQKRRRKEDTTQGEKRAAFKEKNTLPSILLEAGSIMTWVSPETRSTGSTVISINKYGKLTSQSQ